MTLKLSLILVTMGVCLAQADTILRVTGSTLYGHRLDPGSQLRPGDYFTIYDVPDLTAIPTVSFWLGDSWEYIGSVGVPDFDSQMVFLDDDSLPNVSFAYKGVVLTSAPGSGSIEQIGFRVPSTIPFPRYFGIARNRNGIVSGQFGAIEVKLVEDPVPEPATGILVAAAVGGLFCVRRATRKA